MSQALRAVGERMSPEPLVAAARAERLTTRVGGVESSWFERARWVSPLRVAALTLSASLLAAERVEDHLRPRPGGSEPPEAFDALRRWQAYFDALDSLSEAPDLDDAVLFGAIALAGRRPVELRSFLRSAAGRHLLDQPVDPTAPWPDRVRESISRALLLLIRQENHVDLREATAAMEALASLQREHDPSWALTASRASALTVLGLYHLAHAVTRLAEFLLAGSVRTNGRPVRDFAAELQRLIVKAEEYLTLGGDPEVLQWLHAVAILLWRSRSDSVWVSARGISERVDRLVDSLVASGRDHPLFTLLPSQQDALRSRLLDPTQVAVVLQMPTSSGKTLLAEFAIAQVFGAYREGVRVAYVCPTRALATQVRRTLAEDLGPLGIQVSAAGGAFEEDPYELQLLQDADGVVVATPEKLDLLVRAHPEWAEGLRLVVVDEAHLLADAERGARLELLLANLRREQPQARLLLLTPFVQNAQAIADWLGEERGVPIDVRWRPTRLLLGAAEFSGRGHKRQCAVTWYEPHPPAAPPNRLVVPSPQPTGTSTRDRVVRLRAHFQGLGTLLGLFSLSRTDAERAAEAAAQESEPLAELTPALRVAIAAAEYDYGNGCALARALRSGVAFHHSALSPLLRYLIEDQVRAGTIRFVAATTTLAQGMNFPVSMVLVHSVQKPHGGGRLSPSEFWNIAGRAGRVGLAEEGYVVFAGDSREEDLQLYRTALNEPVYSAILAALSAGALPSLKEAYQQQPALRPFLQYLAHAVAQRGYRDAVANVEELVQGSLASRQARNAGESADLRAMARRYLAEIAGKSVGYLKATDGSGLGHFSFDTLYAAMQDDPVLHAGPGEVMRRGVDGLRRLVDALKWLPELDLAVGKGKGQMDAAAVARVAAAWIAGRTVHSVASEFPGERPEDRVRNAGTYVYSTLSSMLSWGAHAYQRGWALTSKAELPPEARMLPAYLQAGVGSPEAAVASLLGVPRPVCEAVGRRWVREHGPVTPETSAALRAWVERADSRVWAGFVDESPWAGRVSSEDLRRVVRQMQGLR